MHYITKKKVKAKRKKKKQTVFWYCSLSRLFFFEISLT